MMKMMIPLNSTLRYKHSSKLLKTKKELSLKLIKKKEN